MVWISGICKFMLDNYLEYLRIWERCVSLQPANEGMRLFIEGRVRLAGCFGGSLIGMEINFHFYFADSKKLLTFATRKRRRETGMRKQGLAMQQQRFPGDRTW